MTSSFQMKSVEKYLSETAKIYMQSVSYGSGPKLIHYLVKTLCCAVLFTTKRQKSYHKSSRSIQVRTHNAMRELSTQLAINCKDVTEYASFKGFFEP